MEILIITLCTAAVFAAGFYLGYVRCSHDMIGELTDLVMENITDLEHEIVDEQHFLYYAESGEFGAQGATLDEAAKNFSERDKSIGRFVSPLGIPMFIVDGKIETE
jgi:hypothetical protein